MCFCSGERVSFEIGRVPHSNNPSFAGLCCVCVCVRMLVERRSSRAPRRLEFFLTHTKKVGEEDKLFVGKAALAEIYTEVLGGGKVPTELGQLDSLGTFSFLLGATEKTALDNATKALVSAGSRRGATSASSSGGARAEKAKVSKKGSRKDDDIASAAALFGM